MAGANPFTDDYAIVVGVDHYGPGIPPLGGCVNDAELFRDWLVDPAGGGLDPGPPPPGEPPHVRVICSPRLATGAAAPVPPPQWPPVRNEVEDAIHELANLALVRQGRVGRRLYLWFSGHGVAVQNLGQECAALMADARDGRFTRSIPGRRAADCFAGTMLFQEVVLVMACCRTAVAATTETALAFPFPPDPAVAANVRQLYGFAARWSAATTEKLLPHPFDPAQPSRVQGVFAHAFLKGLRRAVDDNGEVTAESLAGYVKGQVPELFGGETNLDPDIAPADRAIVLRARGPSQAEVTLANPAAGFRVFRANDLTSPVLVVPATAAVVHPLSLDSGRYVFQAPDPAQPFGRMVGPVTVVAGEVSRVQL